MAATPKFGAALGVDVHTTKVDVDKKIEIHTWKNKSGVTLKVHEVDPTTEFTVEIEGDAVSDFTPGIISTLPLSGITGGVTVCPSVKYSESNDGKATTTVTGTHYPSASELT
jgi:hypothetical protein